MSSKARRALLEASGISELDWDIEHGMATLSGSAAQLEKAEELLRRAVTHCQWGVSEQKVLGFLPRRGLKMT